MAEIRESLHGPPVRLGPDTAALAKVLALVRVSFAYMDGRIDPPSSMHRLTVEALARASTEGEVWAIGDPPVACMVLTPRPGRLYLGKMAVAEASRGRGLARRLVALAEDRARALGLPALELESRIELTEVHCAFERMGFASTGTTSHSGYDRPTSLTFRRPVCEGP